MEYGQYQVVIVNLDPTVGSEIKKTRPCVIVSPNEMNKYLRTVTIVPVTSQSKVYPTRVEITLQGNQNWAVIDQIRTIDKSRITKTVGSLSDEESSQIKQVIRETFVDWRNNITVGNTKHYCQQAAPPQTQTWGHATVCFRYFIRYQKRKCPFKTNGGISNYP